MIFDNLLIVTPVFVFCPLFLLFVLLLFVICYFSISFMIKQRYTYLIKIDVYYSIGIYKINFPILHIILFFNFCMRECALRRYIDRAVR